MWDALLIKAAFVSICVFQLGTERINLSWSLINCFLQFSLYKRSVRTEKKRQSLRSVLPMWHLTGTAHVEGLDHGAQAIGYHRDDILTVGTALRRLHHGLGVQQQRGIFAGYRGFALLLFQEKWRNVISWGWGCCVRALLLQLSGDENQPFVQRVPQQLQRLHRNTRERQHGCASQDQSREMFPFDSRLRVRLWSTH